jgi:hypothetical protein
MPSAPVFDKARQDRLPAFFLAGHHQRDHHGAVGPVAFDFAYLLQIEFQVAVGDEFDVVEAQQAAVRRQQCAIARAVDIDDGWPGFTQRLPDHTAPAGLKRAVDVVGLVGGRGGGEPEGVGALDAGEVGV